MTAKQTVLLTGVSGFVGGALGNHLRRTGFDVTGVSRRSPRPDAADRFIRHDLARPLPENMPRHDVVVHAAGVAVPWAHPAAYERGNVAATRHVAEYAVRTGAEHFVFVSSTAVQYVLGDQFDLTEGMPLPPTPVNAYAASKRKAEAIVESAGLKRALVIRPRAVYGPGDSMLMPRIIRAARAGMFPEFVRRDGGSPTMNLIYIGNLVHALERAIAGRLDGRINVTDGSPVDINAMVSDVLAGIGCYRRRWRISVAAAMRVAGVAEWLSAHCLGWREPPITRFGVSALSHSKTFDVSRMLERIGPMPFTPKQGVAALVDWLKEQEDI